MEQLPELVLCHIGSFLSTKDCASCHLASSVLRPICNSIKRHYFDYSNQVLSEKLLYISAVMPCLESCEIRFVDVSEVQRAPRSCKTGAMMELLFERCSELAIDSVIEWFDENIQASVDWRDVTGNELFLRHDIHFLNTSVSCKNAHVLHNSIIGKIPVLGLAVYVKHLDLSGIDITHNKELYIFQGMRGMTKYTCTDAWKITKLIDSNLDCFNGICIESMCDMHKSRMEMIKLYCNSVYQLLPLLKLVPRRMDVLLKPYSNALDVIGQMKRAGFDQVSYLYQAFKPGVFMKFVRS